MKKGWDWVVNLVTDADIGAEELKKKIGPIGNEQVTTDPELAGGASTGNEQRKTIPELAGDALHKIGPIGNGKGTIPELAGGPSSTNSTTNVDKIEIKVEGAGDPQAVANETHRIFQQTAQDLNSAVHA